MTISTIPKTSMIRVSAPPIQWPISKSPLTVILSLPAILSISFTFLTKILDGKDLAQLFKTFKKESRTHMMLDVDQALMPSPSKLPSPPKRSIFRPSPRSINSRRRVPTSESRDTSVQLKVSRAGRKSKFIYEVEPQEKAHSITGEPSHFQSTPMLNRKIELNQRMTSPQRFVINPRKVKKSFKIVPEDPNLSKNSNDLPRGSNPNHNQSKHSKTSKNGNMFKISSNTRGSYNFNAAKTKSPYDDEVMKKKAQTAKTLRTLTNEVKKKIEAIEMRYISNNRKAPSSILISNVRGALQTNVPPAYLRPKPNSVNKKKNKRAGSVNAGSNFDFSLLGLLKNQRMMERKRKRTDEQTRNYYAYKDLAEHKVFLEDTYAVNAKKKEGNLGKINLSKINKAQKSDMKKIFVDKNGKIIEYVVEKNQRKPDRMSNMQQNEAMQKEFMIVSGQALKKTSKKKQKINQMAYHIGKIGKTGGHPKNLPKAPSNQLVENLRIENKRQEKVIETIEQNLAKTREDFKRGKKGPNRGQIRQIKHKRRMSLKESPYIEINTKRIKLPTTKQFNNNTNLEDSNPSIEEPKRPMSKQKKRGVKGEWDELAMYCDSNMTYIRKPVTYERLLIDNRRKRRENGDYEMKVGARNKIIRNAWI